jgi:hypothetical protein
MIFRIQSTCNGVINFCQIVHETEDTEEAHAWRKRGYLYYLTPQKHVVIFNSGMTGEAPQLESEKKLEIVKVETLAKILPWRYRVVPRRAVASPIW